MNGNIFNYPLALEPDSVDGRSAYAIPPNPPASIFAQSYINAYSTAFNQPVNYQYSLNNYYQPFTWSEVNNNNFVPGTFGYQEEYNSQSNLGSITINYLQDNTSVYFGAPFLFISAGSGGGSSYMYLDWVIVTYGVPYIVNAS